MTHLMQPLDVSVFRPIKVTWQNLYKEWRQENAVGSGIKKNAFPALLKELMSQMDPNHLINGNYGNLIISMGKRKFERIRHKIPHFCVIA